MDPLYHNLGLSAHNNRNSTSLSSQINGLPQESKLASYISNRQQPIQPSFIKNLAALGLEGAGLGLSQLKSSGDPNVPEFVPRTTSPLSSSLSQGVAHSTSTPSFQSSVPRLQSPIGAPQSSLGYPLGGSSASHQAPASPSRSPPHSRRSPDPRGGNSSATYQENVGGTTYFYTAQEMAPFPPSSGTSVESTVGVDDPSSTGPPSQPPMMVSSYHILPHTPAHLHHLKVPNNAPHFFMGDGLRNDILEKQSLALIHVNAGQYPDLPTEVDMYHELVPVESPNLNVNKSSMFGFATSVYKATNLKSGIHYALFRIHGFRLSNLKVTQLVDLWKKMQHSSVVTLREVFTSKDFGDNSIVFVYDFHAGAETLASRHLAGGSNSWDRLVAANAVTGQNGGSNGAFTNGIDGPGGTKMEASGGTSGMLAEATLWNYIIQLTGALRTIHTQGLACRTLDPTKILITDNKSRVRINCCGILDILNFDPNAANPLAGVPQFQQEDLVNLGKLMVALACGSVMALQRDNIQVALDLINRTYSRDLSMFYTALEMCSQKCDVYEMEIGKEIHNGRLFRLVTKLSMIIDRAQLNMDPSWSETGDRYMLKLFQDYLFHQVTEDGRPWLDLGHVVSVLNKLDSASPDKICLMSHDEQNILVVSYAELKHCFERSYTELLQAATSHKTSLS